MIYDDYQTEYIMIWKEAIVIYLKAVESMESLRKTAKDLRVGNYPASQMAPKQ
jgi:hypothetical protein